VAQNAQIAANAKDQEGIQNTLKKAFGNEEMWLTLALGFNSMRMRPDAGLAGVIGNRLESIRSTKRANQTIAALRAKGTPAAISAADYIEQTGDAKGGMKMAMEAGQYISGTGADIEAQFGKMGLDPTKPYRFNKLTGKVESIGGAGTVVNVGTKEGEKLAVADAQPIFQAAFQAPENIKGLQDTIDLIKTQDINVGVLNEWKNLRDKILTTFGDEAAEGRLTYTQLLNSSLGSEVFRLQKALGLGARGMDTPAEREFMREALTGNLALTKDALIGLAERRVNTHIQAIKNYEREKDSPAMKSYASQRAPITYTSKDFERKKPEAPKVQKRIRYDAQGNRI
jgi:hypothetical protein